MDGNIIELNNVTYQYPSGAMALNGVDLKLPRGKKIALLGANGAGKSTLLLLLNGILKPSIGLLKYQGCNYRYKKKDLKDLRRKVGLLFQDSDHQLIAPTVYEEISFGLCNLYDDKALVRSKVEESIHDFCLERIRNKSPHQLSAGQKKRVCLASIIAMQPELLVCDEPSSNLDHKHTEITFKILNKLQGKGKTILISTHDVNRAYAWADVVVLMKEGEILITGAPNEVFSNKSLMEKAGIKQPILVEASQALWPDIDQTEFPKDITAFKKLLNQVSCADLS
ncbi:ABC transporter ATP-binding protein [Labilibacter sediminis]|nr:ABC transporter ATP-binding protein [Labilibacter sediminis]